MRARGIGSLVQHTLQLVTQEPQCIVTYYFLQLLVQQKLDLLPDTTPVKLKFLYTLTWPAFWRNFDSRTLSIFVFSAMLDTSLSLSCSSPEIEKSAVLQMLQIWAFRATRNSRALSRKSGVNLLSTNLSDSLQYTRNISSHTSPWQLSLNKVSDTPSLWVWTHSQAERICGTGNKQHSKMFGDSLKTPFQLQITLCMTLTSHWCPTCTELFNLKGPPPHPEKPWAGSCVHMVLYSISSVWISFSTLSSLHWTYAWKPNHTCKMGTIDVGA